MQAIRAIILATFFLGTFSIRGWQAVMAAVVSGPASASIPSKAVESNYGHYSNNAPGRPDPVRRLRLSRVPRVTPPRIDITRAPLPRVYAALETSLQPTPRIQQLLESVGGSGALVLPRLFAARSERNRAPPSSLLG